MHEECYYSKITDFASANSFGRLAFPTSFFIYFSKQELALGLFSLCRHRLLLTPVEKRGFMHKMRRIKESPRHGVFSRVVEAE